MYSVYRVIETEDEDTLKTIAKRLVSPAPLQNDERLLMSEMITKILDKSRDYDEFTNEYGGMN